MTYHFNIKPVQKRRSPAKFALLGLILVAFTLAIPPVRESFSRTVHQSLSHVLSLQKEVSLATPSITLRSRSSLLNENKLLKSALTEKETLLLDKTLLEEENASLREALGRIGDQKMIMAAVLSKPTISLYDTFIVNAGEKEGVIAGSEVLAYGNIPIGIVKEVYPRTSLIRLYSSPGEEIPVRVASSSIEAVAHGVGGGNFKMLLPKENGISIGEKVTVSAERPYLLGIIEHIEIGEAETLAHVFFKSPVNIRTLSKIYIKVPIE